MIEVKTAAEIILETIQYYGQDPMGRRGIKRSDIIHTDEDGKQSTKVHSSCQYVVDNGETKYCAIGRCLTDDAKEWAKNAAGGVSEIIREWWTINWAHDEFDNTNDDPEQEYYVGNENQDPQEDETVYLDDMLQPAYSGQEVEFWEKLQELHDDDPNWGDGTIWLTEDGYHHVQDMVDMCIHDPVERQAFMADLQAHTEEFTHDKPFQS